MNPTSFEIIKGVTHFRYPYSYVKQWVNYHRTEGNAGAILVRRDGMRFIYLCSGTIEHPATPSKPFSGVNMLSLLHNDIFDGLMGSDEDRCKPYKNTFFSNPKFYIIDLEDDGKLKLIN